MEPRFRYHAWLSHQAWNSRTWRRSSGSAGPALRIAGCFDDAERSPGSRGKRATRRPRSPSPRARA